MYFNSGIKKVPDKIIYILSRTNKLIRGATLIHKKRALSRILSYPRQLTYAPRHGILGKQNSFDRTLSSPFNNLRSYPALIICQTLCTVHLLFLSLLHRFVYYLIVINIFLACKFVNGFLSITLYLI